MPKGRRWESRRSEHQKGPFLLSETHMAPCVAQEHPVRRGAMVMPSPTRALPRLAPHNRHVEAAGSLVSSLLSRT